MTISKERLDELLKGCERPEDLLGDTGLMKELKIKRRSHRRLYPRICFPPGDWFPIAGRARRRSWPLFHAPGQSGAPAAG
jgi:hypothetical protein